MCYCCKCDANAMQRERVERKGDIPICDISGYRETERPRDREIGRSEERELKSAGGWKANNRVSIANAPK